MKYFIVIDGALNSTHDIFGVDEVTFEIVFPDDTDVAFLDEVAERVKSLEMDKAIFFDKLLLNQVDKKVINGLHGTLHSTGSYRPKEFIPTQKESEAIKNGRGATPESTSK